MPPPSRLRAENYSIFSVISLSRSPAAKARDADRIISSLRESIAKEDKLPFLAFFPPLRRGRCGGRRGAMATYTSSARYASGVSTVEFVGGDARHPRHGRCLRLRCSGRGVFRRSELQSSRRRANLSRSSRSIPSSSSWAVSSKTAGKPFSRKRRLAEATKFVTHPAASDEDSAR